jgi:hypothetical protein
MHVHTTFIKKISTTSDDLYKQEINEYTNKYNLICMVWSLHLMLMENHY